MGKRRIAGIALALMVLAQMQAPIARGSVGGLDACTVLRMGTEYLWSTAIEDRDRPDKGIVTNRILRATGEPDERGHNDDSLTTGSYIAAMVKLYEATGDEAFLEKAREAAELFNPARRNGPVFWYDDDPDLYFDPRDRGAEPKPGTVYWGFNGTRWLMPTTEQAAGAVYGLYHLWRVTGDERYSEWIRILADANLPSASLMVALVMAEAAYQATGEERYAAIVDQRLRELEAAEPPSWKETICASSHGANYVSMALDFPRLRKHVASYVERVSAPIVLGILYNESTGAVYYKRAYVPGRGLTFYSPSCSGPGEDPGAPGDPAWVVSSFNAILWARVFILTYNATGDRELFDAAVNILGRMTGEVILQPLPGDSPSIQGAIPPFVFDAIPPADNAYWISHTRQVSSQAVVSLILAVTALESVRGGSLGCLMQEQAGDEDAVLETEQAETSAGNRIVGAVAATLAGWLIYALVALRREGRL